MRTKQDLNNLIDTKGAELKKLFDDHKDAATGAYTHSADQVAEINTRNNELTELGKELDQVIALEEAEKGLKSRQDRDKTPVGTLPHPTGQKADDEPKLKTVRQILDESVDYQSFLKGASKTAIFDIPEREFKTLITLATMTPQAERRQGFVPMALEERTVADLMMSGATGGTSIEYYEQTTMTNNAAEVAEAGTKPESAIAFTLRTDTVRKIATWIPVTDETLKDVPRMQSIIEGTLMFMVKRREEHELLLGDGVAPNILGVELRSGVQTYALNAEPVPDAIYKGMNKVRNTGFAEPTAVVFHPNDWMGVRLLRTVDGIYIWGSPSDAGPERIWGLGIRQTSEQTENTALVGAFRPWSEVVRRDGLTITASSEHSTYFVENKIAILAEERLALVVPRPSAFCTVTGI